MVIEPDSADALAGALRHASETRQAVVIRGAGTKHDWGRPLRPVDLVVSTTRLNRVLAHEHGDLVASVEAGATLADVNRALAARGQWLPLDPPFSDRATIGGILATNDSGPLRHRYGTPRDLVIGVRVATADGVLASAGGRVVKNVAGYDLAKLVSGSFGSLAAIVSATFKLAPLPQASKTIAIDVPDRQTVAAIVRELMASQLEPIAFEVRSRISQNLQNTPRPQHQLLIRFASVSAAVDAQIAAVARLAGLKACATTVAHGDDEHMIWREHADGIWARPGAVIRASWLPADVAAVLDTLQHVGASADVELIGRAALGSGLIRVDADAHTQAALVRRLRESTHCSHVVIVRAPDELKNLVDVWGPQGDREKLMRALKAALDPHDILNAGRGPL